MDFQTTPDLRPIANVACGHYVHKSRRRNVYYVHTVHIVYLNIFGRSASGPRQTLQRTCLSRANAKSSVSD